MKRLWASLWDGFWVSVAFAALGWCVICDMAHNLKTGDNRSWENEISPDR